MTAALIFIFGVLVVYVAVRPVWQHRRQAAWFASEPAALAAYTLGCFGGLGSAADVAAEGDVPVDEARELLVVACARGWAAETADGRFAVLDGNLSEAQRSAIGFGLP